MEADLSRFLSAQSNSYQSALSEIKSGKKNSHWMWFIFPQIAGLGFSDTAKFYSIKDLDEAKEYLKHEILGPRLLEITNVLLTDLKGKTANQVFGHPDDLKLWSCMTLFKYASGGFHPVFEQVLDRYFGGKEDAQTVKKMGGL